MEPDHVQKLFELPGNLALQIALCIAVVGLISAVLVMWRTGNRANKEKFDELMRHHDDFAKEVRQERTQWQGVLVQVVKDNTSAMEGLKGAIKQVLDLRN